ncbi:MAG: ATP cone domain-containing protein [bacterium]|nr:hypothetical protein [Planctomycetota bacterium]
MSVRRVRKRDGREEPFEKQKIEAAVLAAQAAVGEDDQSFAREVSELVELALRRRYAWTGPRRLDPISGHLAAFPNPAEGPETSGETELYEPADGDEDAAPESIPSIEEIQDLVEVGLIELGRAALAKAYILYRDRRSRTRASLGEGTPPSAADCARISHMRVCEDGGSLPWSKSRIAAALVNEANLSREAASALALRVEDRVLALGLRQLSTSLVRELVAGEMLAMGLTSALARQAPVTLPRHDLRQCLATGPDTSSATSGVRRAVSEVLGGELLRRFASSEILSERAAEAQRGGELFLEDLSAPHLYLTQSISSDLLLRGAPGSLAAFDALPEIASLCGAVSRGIVLEAPSSLLQPVARASRGEGQTSLTAWLLSLASVARAAGRRIDLASAGQRAPALLARLMAEMLELSRGAEVGSLARLFVSANELEQTLEHDPNLAEVVDALLERQLVVPTWGGAAGQIVAPGCLRAPREQGALACGGAVAINLVRLAERAGPWREDLVLESLARRVEEAVETLASLAAFQRDQRAARPGEARGRVSYALTPVGLRECLRLLGDGELRAAQGARLLGLICDGARRFAAKRGLAVNLTPCFGAAAARGFEHLDRSSERLQQGLLFGDATRSQNGYSTGYTLGHGDLVGAGAQEAELLSTVAAGPWLAQPLARDSREPLVHLAAWRRFLVERAALHAATALDLPETAASNPANMFSSHAS